MRANSVLFTLFFLLFSAIVLGQQENAKPKVDEVIEEYKIQAVNLRGEITGDSIPVKKGKLSF